MTSDEYVLSVVRKYKAATGQGSPGYSAAQALYPMIKQWATTYLLDAKFSGSYAKDTAIRGLTDVDIFISLDPSTPGSLKDIYENVVNLVQSRGLYPRRQNVSVRVTYQGTEVDLVPGRKQSGNTNDHSIFHRKSNTWRQTNVDKHISVVTGAGRTNEIVALKVWRQLHGLDFPSFYLELVVLRALSGRRTDTLAENVLAALNWIAINLQTARLEDPANTNNIVSDDLTQLEKRSIANQAAISAAKPYWSHIVW